MLILLFAARLLAAEVLDNAAVVRMVGAGLGADVVTLKIERSQARFDTSADALIALKAAHVPDGVIRAMLMKESAPVIAAPAVADVAQVAEPAPVPTVPLAATPSSAAAPSAAAPPAVPLAARPSPARRAEDVCANVKFYTTSNDGLAWVPSNVCVGETGVSVDEQTIALSDIVAQCSNKPAALVLGGSLLRGDQEWWLGDGKETLKFRGKPEELERLAAALTHAGGSIPRGGCGDREIRKRLTR